MELLFESANQAQRPARREKANRVRGKRHGERAKAKFFGSLHNRFQDFLMAEVKAIKIANADDCRVRDVGIG